MKVNENTGHVVDGHLRAMAAISRGESTVPVTYLDLSEIEEQKMLATFDKITEAAASDDDKLRELLRAFGDDMNPALRALYDDDVLPNLGDDPMPSEAFADGSKFLVMVECETETEQTALLERFLAMDLKVRAVSS